MTIVEFSDFQCPFFVSRSSRRDPGVVEIRREGEARLPGLPALDTIHPQARKAAEVVRCAQDQGKFWEYHDALVANSPNLSPAQLTVIVGTALVQSDIPLSKWLEAVRQLCESRVPDTVECL